MAWTASSTPSLPSICEHRDGSRVKTTVHGNAGESLSAGNDVKNIQKKDVSAVVLGHSVARLAVLLLGCALVVEKGLLIFGVLLVVSSLVAWRQQPSPPSIWPYGLKTVGWLAVATNVVVLCSLLLHDQPLRTLDNVSRLLLIPWCAWLASTMDIRRSDLWWSSVSGLVLAFAVACWQVSTGTERAGLGNPIVFANLILVLLVVVTFLGPDFQRPSASLLRWLVVGLGVAAIVMTGSRAALVTSILLMPISVAWKEERWNWRRFFAFLGISLVVILLIGNTPSLVDQMRLDAVVPNVNAYLKGDPDSPIGARFQLWKMAWDTFLQHPISGIGIQRFGSLVDQLPGCETRSPMGMCVLGHAHNDLAEWAATMGIPGLLMILAIYGIPIALFMRLGRAAMDLETKTVARTGLVVVFVYVVAGLSQSMFAHALSASAYAIIVGFLLGQSGRRRVSMSTGTSAIS